MSGKRLSIFDKKCSRHNFEPAGQPVRKGRISRNHVGMKNVFICNEDCFQQRNSPFLPTFQNIHTIEIQSINIYF